MKYKANFRPQQILGNNPHNPFNWSQFSSDRSQLQDPESLEWGPLDSELAAILDKKRYYSRSGHQKEQQQLGNSTTSDDMIKTFEDPLPPPSLPTNEPDPKDPETEDEEDEPEIPDVSLFTLNLPGVMTKEEVLSQIDLGHWKLLIRGKTIDLEVRESLSPSSSSRKHIHISTDTDSLELGSKELGNNWNHRFSNNQRYSGRIGSDFGTKGCAGQCYVVVWLIWNFQLEVDEKDLKHILVMVSTRRHWEPPFPLMLVLPLISSKGINCKIDKRNQFDNLYFSTL